MTVEPCSRHNMDETTENSSKKKKENTQAQMQEDLEEEHPDDNCEFGFVEEREPGQEEVSDRSRDEHWMDNLQNKYKRVSLHARGEGERMRRERR